jgi:hypothetical protein
MDAVKYLKEQNYKKAKQSFGGSIDVVPYMGY